MNPKPGAAAERYAKQQHPRLLVDDTGLGVIRKQITRGAGKRVMAALRKKTAFYASQVLDDPSWSDVLNGTNLFWPVRVASFMWGLADMAMVGALDETAREREAVTRVFEAMPWLGYDRKTGGLVDHQFYMPPMYVPFAYDLAASWLSADVRRAYVDWAVRVHVDQIIAKLEKNYLKSPGANIPLGGMLLAVLTALVIEGERGAPNLTRQKAILTRWLEASINASVTPDGYPQEDIGYGTVVVPMLMQVASAAQRAGLLDVDRRAPRMRNFGRAMLHFTQPFGEHLSLTGDHGDQFKDRQFALGTLAAANGDKSLRWLIGALTYAHYRTLPGDNCVELDAELALTGKRSVPVSWLTLITLDELRLDEKNASIEPAKMKPAIPTAFLDRSRGLMSLRSGWNAHDTLVVFDAGQRSAAAPGHHHCSSGHFSITARGELFAIDTGRYNIEQSQHNLVLVDGKSGRTSGGEWIADYHPGRLIEYSPDEFCDFAAVDSSHQHNCMWAYRSLGLVKPVGVSAKQSAVPAYTWTVEDVNKNNDYADFWWTLNTSPGNTIEVHETDATPNAMPRATITGWREGNQMDVHIVIPPSEEFAKSHTLTMSQDINTTSSHKYVGDSKSAATRYGDETKLVHGPVFLRPRLIAKIFGASGRFISLMIPRGKNERAAKVTRLPTIENALAVNIELGDAKRTTDTLIWAYDHELLEADGVVARGQWCLVRRERKTGRVIAHRLHRGVMLEVDGRTLI